MKRFKLNDNSKDAAITLTINGSQYGFMKDAKYATEVDESTANEIRSNPDLVEVDNVPYSGPYETPPKPEPTKPEAPKPGGTVPGSGGTKQTTAPYKPGTVIMTDNPEALVPTEKPKAGKKARGGRRG